AGSRSGASIATQEGSGPFCRLNQSEPGGAEKEMPEHLGRVVIVRKLSSQGSPVDSGNIVSTRLVLILPSFPKLSETFIVSKFLGLLERGWDVHVVCGMSEEAQFRHFPNLENRPEARRRIKVAWPHRPRWLAGLLMPFAFLHCLWSNPGGTWR